MVVVIMMGDDKHLDQLDVASLVHSRRVECIQVSVFHLLHLSMQERRAISCTL